MNTFFLTCAAVGGVLVVAQFVLGAVGMGHHDIADGPGDGLQMFSVRALSAGLAFFGFIALGASRVGFVWPLAVATGALAGVATMFGVAMAMRAMVGLQRDASVHVERAIGERATVYVPIPAARGGVGKVSLAVRGRTVEYQAVTADAAALATGTAVLVVNVHDHDIVEVVPLPSVDGDL